MKPLRSFVAECRAQSRETFVAEHPHPFLVYSVVRGGDLKPAAATSGLTLDRLVLEDACRQLVSTPPEDWYVVFELTPGEPGASRVVLGCSGSCDVLLNDASISRLHASVERRGETFYLRDEDSSAGTAVDGELLEPHVPARLVSGQRIGFGTVDVVFHLPGDFHDFVLRVALD